MNKNLEKKEWLRIFEYAKLVGKPSQTVYRWIRERKINENDVKKIIVEVERMMIRNPNDK